MDNIIEVRGLCKSYPGVDAVSNLDFSVQAGDVYGFLGQNGAGKSTSIRMMLGLVRPSAGEIRLFGMNLASHRNEILAKTGAMIERPDLYKYLSAYDNLALFARMSHIRPSRKIIMDKLELVGLAERYNSPAHTFSQGMKQRLGIAVALVHEPELVILDEPTNGLDPQGIADIRKLIISLSRDYKKTVLVSSHLLGEIELMANRMIILDKGKRVAEGYVADLLNPANTLVTLETQDTEKARLLLQEAYPLWPVNIQGSLMKIHMDKSKVPELAALLVHRGIGIVSLQPRHSLEDYFLSLTNPGRYVEPAAN